MSAEQESTRFWEGMYGERDRVWSGQPNQALVATASVLTPGRALDLGCGEGADTVWLARQGWQVTGVDISATAVQRARVLAAGSDAPEGSIEWLVEDLASWSPAGPYELVSACFLHSPVDFPRTDVLRRAARAVAPGGHLLVVGHAEFPPWSQHRHEHSDGAEPRLLSPAEELAVLDLPTVEWDEVVGETRPRRAVGPDGQRATLEDAVLLLHRRHSAGP